MRVWFACHRLKVFFVLAFLLSWYPWLIALARGTTTGPNPLGPFVAALIVTAIAFGKRDVRELLAKIVRWRVGVKPYAFAFGIPVLFVAAALGVTVVFGSGSVKPAPVLWTDLLETFIFIFLFIGLGEEPGWRGFALPELQQRYSATLATLILSAIWAVWHLPLIGNEFPYRIVPAFLVSLFGASFVQTWLFNQSGQSVFIQMLFHATVNTVGAGLVFKWVSGGDVLLLWWSQAVIWLVAGALSVLATRPFRAARYAASGA